MAERFEDMAAAVREHAPYLFDQLSAAVANAPGAG